MELFGEEHSRLLLGREWLVKVDSDESKPYMLKYSHTDGGKCFMMVTDTVQVWAEVLSPAQLARRWSSCNTDMPFGPLDDQARDAALKLLTSLHSLHAFGDLDFEASRPPTCDLALKLEHETSDASRGWNWRWEAFAVGSKLSSNILSQHLIMPLVTTVHLAFQSPESLAELAERDLEQATDKMTRTARRSIDTHVRNALSRPRTVFTLRRITQMLYSLGEISPIASGVKQVDLSPAGFLQQAPQPDRLAGPSSGPVAPEDPGSPSPRMADAPLPERQLSDGDPEISLAALRPRGKLVRRTVRPASPSPAPHPGPVETDALKRTATPPALLDVNPAAPPLITAGNQPDRVDVVMKDSSETEESENEADGPVAGLPSKGKMPRPPSPSPRPPPAAGAASGSESSPVRPKKKPKAVSSSDDDDSEAERRRHVAKMVGGSKRTGTRQPIKRGGKRF